jgi:hypothetical protein
MAIRSQGYAGCETDPWVSIELSLGITMLYAVALTSFLLALLNIKYIQQCSLDLRQKPISVAEISAHYIGNTDYPARQPLLKNRFSLVAPLMSSLIRAKENRIIFTDQLNDTLRIEVAALNVGVGKNISVDQIARHSHDFLLSAIPIFIDDHSPPQLTSNVPEKPFYCVSG